MDDYLGNLISYECNVFMVEPALYDEYYDSIENISELISGDIEARIHDEVDGEIYGELLKDLRVDIDNRKDLAEDQIVAMYDVLYQKDFIQKLSKFFQSCKLYFNDSISLENLMSQFSYYSIINDLNTSGFKAIKYLSLQNIFCLLMLTWLTEISKL
ncbi:hypothetical protein LY90DRAFT_498800 [Neocallimastix californiae]|uniref:Uncharacterized protein n=1 Tax=Neocallimastix californiae TaxID=1754190 RepID=A0A1Y2FTQ1_9FUNG|nr:hypothetical protein LY90DRAFT_498800 [Neocallimastix californiae]|eukprot:ORY86566.1 hypothetical protein LY90DRAFT_498800 [Neocallimastix californiae]